MARGKEKPVIKFVKLHKDATVPTYAYADDAGLDLYSAISGTIKRGAYKLFPLGIASEIPRGWMVSFRGRGSLAVKAGINILAGVIDSGYRGEWIVILSNLGRKPYKVVKGERIAQGILQPAPQAKIVSVKRLGRTERGAKGFGSTGKK